MFWSNHTYSGPTSKKLVCGSIKAMRKYFIFRTVSQVYIVNKILPLVTSRAATLWSIMTYSKLGENVIDLFYIRVLSNLFIKILNNSSAQYFLTLREKSCFIIPTEFQNRSNRIISLKNMNIYFGICVSTIVSNKTRKSIFNKIPLQWPKILLYFSAKLQLVTNLFSTLFLRCG